MNVHEIVEQARRSYLEELAQFVLRQASRFRRGAAEVQTAREGVDGLFGDHYRADFIGQEGAQAEPLDLVPDRRMRLDASSEGASGATRVRIEQIVWDDVEISHDAPGDLTVRLSDWFDHWYDPDDVRKPTAEGEAVGVIHALGVYPGALVVDFGSAPTAAFWALVVLLRDAGATGVTIRETREPV